MPDLVQTIPALRQSMVETAACPRSYVAIYIDGQGGGDSIPSERGTDIHHVMSEYVRHCATLKIKADWAEFDRLASASGPDAGRVLDGIRDRFQVNPDRVYGTEVTLALDENFLPTLNAMDRDTGEVYEIATMPGVTYTANPAAHIGTLDVILLSEDGRRGKVPDYKSHFAIFEADTFQSTLYPFLLLKHMPQLDVVTFELNFVRYQNQYRAVTWRREDMPQMQQEIMRARQRQINTHANPDAAMALPCKVCAYCPLAKNLTCPIAEWNEHTAMNNSDRLRAAEYYRRTRKLHMDVLKQHAAVTGPISYTDGNGKVYEYGPQDAPETRYPLDSTTIRVLADYGEATGENLLDGRLNVSSSKLKSLLKAKKREALRTVFEDSIIQTGTKPKFAVRTPEGVEQDFNPYEEE